MNRRSSCRHTKQREQERLCFLCRFWLLAFGAVERNGDPRPRPGTTARLNQVRTKDTEIIGWLMSHSFFSSTSTTKNVSPGFLPRSSLFALGNDLTDRDLFSERDVLYVRSTVVQYKNLPRNSSENSLERQTWHRDPGHGSENSYYVLRRRFRPQNGKF